MMNPTIIDAVCRQVGNEFHTAFLYLSLASDMAAQGYRGAAHWLRQQYGEECSHALKLMDFLEQRKASSAVPRFAQPTVERRSLVDTFQLALDAERDITRAINAMISLCADEQDYATQYLLMGYAAEQVEEENALTEILDGIRMAGDCPEALLSIDRHLAHRGL